MAFVPSFANVSAFATGTGWSWWTPAARSWPRRCTSELRRWSGERLHTAVYSHGHIDHVFGVPVWEAESAERGWPAPVVVAHEALPARFDRYIMTAGYNEVINQRQFGVRRAALAGASTGTRTAPTATRLALEVGGTALRAAAREGRDRRPHRDLGARTAGAVLR